MPAKRLTKLTGRVKPCVREPRLRVLKLPQELGIQLALVLGRFCPNSN